MRPLISGAFAALLIGILGALSSPELSAANEHSHRLGLATDAVFGKRATRRLRTITYVGQHKELDFDPDTGLERVHASASGGPHLFA
jgi:hypothetical protein